MTQDEFEKQYAIRSKITVARLRELRRYAIPCTCDYENCQGWQMICLDDLILEDDFIEIPEPYRTKMRQLKW